MLRDLPRHSLVGHPEPCHHERQERPDHGPEIDKESLDHISLGLLRIIKHVRHEGAERLHGHIEGEVHEKEDERAHRKRSYRQKHRTVRHQEQGYGRDDGPAENVRNTSAEPGPGPIREHAYDGLNDHAGERRGKPEITEMADVGPQRLENRRGVGILQRISYLHPEKTEAQVPDLPERQFRFLHYCSVINRVVS